MDAPYGRLEDEGPFEEGGEGSSGGTALLDEEYLRSDTRALAEQEELPPPPRDVRRTTREGEQRNELDVRATLPLVDSHSHIGGKSLSGQTELRAITRGVGRATIASFLYYNAAPDERIAEKIIDSTKHFRRDLKQPQNVAAVSLVLDLSYIAMRGATAQASRMGSAVGRRENQMRKGNEPLYYTHPDDADSNDYTYVWFPREDSVWNAALAEIAEAAKVRLGMIWPFVGFDPRRPTGHSIVKQQIDTGAFVGVKLYSRTGWMPIHNRRMYGDALGDALDVRLESLYAYCVAQDVPLLVHTSPTGFPTDAMWVAPWPFTPKRLKGFTSTTNVACPRGYGTIPPTLWPPTYGPDDFRAVDKVSEAIKRHASELAHFSLYMQLTTSPYAWLPVLAKYPNLRLCLAHFGAEIGGYATPYRNVPVYEKWQTALELHPYTAGTYPSWNRNFRELFEQGVLHRIREEDKKLAEAAAGRIRGFFNEVKAWSDWFRAWEAAYPRSWHDQILTMIADPARPNLYTDISYLTTIKRQFPIAFGPMIDQALTNTPEGKALRKKLMIGTDWFMIEMESNSPRDFWKMAWNTFKAKNLTTTPDGRLLWRLWSSENALRWVNLKPRMGGRGMNVLESFYFGGRSFDPAKMPPWWSALREHYDQGRHLTVPTFSVDGG